MDERRELDGTTVVKLASEPTSTSVGGETVVLDAASGRYFGLEGVGSRVWELLQSPIRFDALARSIVDEYDVDASTCEQDLRALIGELRDAGLVELETDRP